ncbi:DUF1611 domain-containing protein [Shewanella sp. YLB-07]|uniref:DUF1611 domain-containing protein n=1 Tax=Shewanella sp. YLB-07 TaxID=2601268 RepID=UPI001D149B16|nr:DUF1611 domain-containing protein [Shewanella sp. YLB-07]
MGQLRLSPHSPCLGVNTLIIGSSLTDRQLPMSWVNVIINAIELGFHIAAGTHQRLQAISEIRLSAELAGVQLFDLRHASASLQVGNGSKRTGKRVLTVGSDCSVGKMYTAPSLVEALNQQGELARFVATSQTGILIKGCGIAIDTVAADFVSGAVEQLSPAFTHQTWDVIEGQGSLFNPSCAGVT